MTTTIMRDSVVGDNWIQQTAAAVPVQRVLGADGLPTGDILTGPVRLGYNDLFELPKQKEGESAPKYGAKLLFTPFVDWTIFYEEYYKMCASSWPEFYDAASGQYYGLHSPFHKQQDKAKNAGYTPGLVFMNSTSKFKPPVVDVRHNPIVDKNRVYQGVWAICAVKPYAFGDKKDPKQKKGIGFGLQSVMIIGDDTRLAKGGQAPDTKAQFGGVNIAGIQAPVVRPDVVQGMPSGMPAAPAPAAAIPGYTAPGGGMPQPGQPPAIQQQHWSPPAAPAAPGNYPAPPAVPTSDDDTSWLN